jgi:hypothetical protein
MQLPKKLCALIMIQIIKQIRTTRGPGEKKKKQRKNPTLLQVAKREMEPVIYK